MTITEEQLARSDRRGVPGATARSRKQARRRRNYITLGQVAGCLLAFWGIALLAKLIADVNIPWVLFGVFTLLGTTLAAWMGLDDPANLPETEVPLFRPEDDEVTRPATAQPDTYASAA